MARNVSSPDCRPLTGDGSRILKMITFGPRTKCMNNIRDLPIVHAPGCCARKGMGMPGSLQIMRSSQKAHAVPCVEIHLQNVPTSSRCNLRPAGVRPRERCNQPRRYTARSKGDGKRRRVLATRLELGMLRSKEHPSKTGIVK